MLARHILALTLSAAPCTAQTGLAGVPFSQHGSVTQRVGFTDISIEYNRPVARGRRLFGASGLEKWGRVWHPGADSATTITFSTGTLIEGTLNLHWGTTVVPIRIKIPAP